MYKNSSAPSNNTALWHYLGTKHLDFRHKNNRVLIKEMRCIYIYACVCVLHIYVCVCILYIYIYIYIYNINFVYVCI